MHIAGAWQSESKGLVNGDSKRGSAATVDDEAKAPRLRLDNVGELRAARGRWGCGPPTHKAEAGGQTDQHTAAAGLSHCSCDDDGP